MYVNFKIRNEETAFGHIDFSERNTAGIHALCSMTNSVTATFEVDQTEAMTIIAALYEYRKALRTTLENADKQPSTQHEDAQFCYSELAKIEGLLYDYFENHAEANKVKFANAYSDGMNIF